MKVYHGVDRSIKGKSKRFAAIVDDHCLPISPWVSNYLTIQHSAAPFSTKNQFAKQLVIVLRHFKSHNIDIEERVLSGEFFTVSEIMDFCNSCKYNTSSKLSNVVDINKLNDKSLDNAIHASQVATDSVKAATSKGKIKQFVDFVEFIYLYTHADNMMPAQLTHRYNLLKTTIKRFFESLTKDYNTKCVGEAEQSIPTDKYLKLLEVIRPDSPDNPFKRSKLRNYLMVLLYIETGNRRGDHAGLKISDLTLQGSFDQISIIKRFDDSTDSRTAPASTKTLGHKSYVPKPLMKDIERYINDVRTTYLKSGSHDFLFITENNSKGSAGEPLSLSAIDKMFEKLSKVIGFHIHCHLMRHKFNEILTDIAKQQGIGDVDLDEMRKYLMGWSKNSDMAERYNRFKISVHAREMNQARQDQMTSVIDEKDTL